MEDKKTNPAVLGILIVIIVIAIVLAVGRTRGPRAPMTPEQREWLDMSPEERIERHRQQLVEEGLPPEVIEEEIQMMREMEDF
jgi:hypothetical protein